MTRTLKRCPWPGEHEFYVRYHDEEWGVPLHDDRKLFEFLVLEGAQAGLSWATILRKREGSGRPSRASTRGRSRASAPATSAGCSPTRASSATG